MIKTILYERTILLGTRVLGELREDLSLEVKLGGPWKQEAKIVHVVSGVLKM